MRPGRAADHSPHLVPRSWKSRAIPLLPPMCRTACTEPQCLYSIAIPLLPYGPYGLYRTSVPVQYSYTSTPLSPYTGQLYLYSPMDRTACTEPQCLYSTAIPLLPSVPVQYSYTSTPLWTVRPVQSLSACTVELYLYSPYGPYGLYRASVPVQYSYTSTPLSACTVQLYLYSPYGP